MHDQTKIIHSFSEFNRGLHTRRYIKPTICARDFLTTMSLDLRPEKEWGYHLAKATGVDVSTIVELNLEFVSKYPIPCARIRNQDGYVRNGPSDNVCRFRRSIHTHIGVDPTTSPLIGAYSLRYPFYLLRKVTCTA